VKQERPWTAAFWALLAAMAGWGHEKVGVACKVVQVLAQSHNKARFLLLPDRKSNA
jgi:hypothetical protein